MHCGYFDATRKDNHSSYLTPTVIGGLRPLPSENAYRLSSALLFSIYFLFFCAVSCRYHNMLKLNFAIFASVV